VKSGTSGLQIHVRKVKVCPEETSPPAGPPTDRENHDPVNEVQDQHHRLFEHERDDQEGRDNELNSEAHRHYPN